MVDLVVNFISAYEDDDNNVEKSLPKIVVNYLKTWFLLDLISTIPF